MGAKWQTVCGVVAIVLLGMVGAPARGGLVDVTAPGNPIQGLENTVAGGANTNSTNYPGAEAPPMAIDNNTGTKYLNFSRLNTGFWVTPSSASIVTAFRCAAANDAPERDPMTYTLEGTNQNPATGTWTLIASGNSGIQTDPGRFQWGTVQSFSNPASYTSYRVLFPTVRGPGGNSMQIGEVELLQQTPSPTGRLSVSGMHAVGAAYATDGASVYGPVNWKIEKVTLNDLGPGLNARFYNTGGDLDLNSTRTLSGFNAWCNARTPGVETTLPGSYNLPSLEMPGGGIRSDSGNPFRDASGATIANLGDNEHLLARFAGLIWLPTTGNWTFGSASDDGSIIFLDGNDTALVDNWALQGIGGGGATRTATYNNTVAGWHDIVLGFYEQTGDAGFEFYYQAPGGSLGFIPMTAFHLGSAATQLLLSGNTNIGDPTLDSLFGDLPPGQLDLRLTVTYGTETFVSQNTFFSSPEPTSLALLGLGLAALARRRRK